VHRDYYINSSIKVFLFNDRLEIRSPGKLPNSLNVAKMISGISIHRNPILNSLSQYILPYSGLGSGIRRALNFHPHLSFINDIEKEEFICSFKRSNE
jgi:predicted HTH transcriptional regulator